MSTKTNQDPVAVLDEIKWHYVDEEGLPETDTTVFIALDDPDTDEIEMGCFNGDDWLGTDGDLLAVDGDIYAWAYAPAKPPRAARKGGAK